MSESGGLTIVSDDYAVMRRTVLTDPPEESWWICPACEFHDRARAELPRMLASEISRTIRPMVLGGRLP